MARFHTDEDVPYRLAEELRRLGHDVLTAKEAGQANRGVPDDQVVQFATSVGRAVVTMNRRDYHREHDRLAGRHAGIVTCTDDRDLVALARRIHDAVGGHAALDGVLIKIVRPPFAGRPTTG